MEEAHNQSSSKGEGELRAYHFCSWLLVQMGYSTKR